MQPDTRYARAGDVHIAYQVVGDGPIDLVLVPWFVTHLEHHWEEPGLVRFFERLASFSRLILFDKRGTGLSDRIGTGDRAPTLEERMDDVRAVMDAAGSERAALFGVSEGGPLSILFAATYPERVTSLVLFGTFARLGIADDYRGFEEAWGETDVERALATVLFTDIVSSTERAAELGDRGWRDLLDEHDRLLRAAIERHRGRAVKSLGDGFLATFDGPGRGIRCAQAAIGAARELGLDIRAGLHTGECELTDGDVAGIAVHIGARVGATAGPGEVLVSSTVKDLVVGSGFEFDDRGTHTLKGVPGEWHLYAVGG